MDEKTMLLDLRDQLQRRLELLEQQIILSRPTDDDDEFSFLIKKASSFRDTLEKIDRVGGPAPAKRTLTNNP